MKLIQLCVVFLAMSCALFGQPKWQRINNNQIAVSIPASEFEYADVLRIKVQYRHQDREVVLTKFMDGSKTLPTMALFNVPQDASVMAVVVSSMMTTETRWSAEVSER